MKKNEIKLLVGAFLLISGIFMPFHGISEYFNFQGVIDKRLTGSIFGYQTTIGMTMLIAAILLTIISFSPKPQEHRIRILSIQFFIICLIAVLFITGGIAPLFSAMRFTPHIGLLVVLIGLSISFITVIKELKTK